MGLEEGMGGPALPGTKGLGPRKGENFMIAPSQRNQGVVRSSYGKEDGVEAGSKEAESKWRDGLMGQVIPELPLEGVDRLMKVLRMRTMITQMEDDLSTGVGHVDLGIIWGHTGSRIGMGLEMDMIEEQGINRING